MIEQPQDVEGDDSKANEGLHCEHPTNLHLGYWVGGQHADSRVEPAYDPVEHDGAVQPGNPSLVAPRAGTDPSAAYDREEHEIEGSLAELGNVRIESLGDHIAHNIGSSVGQGVFSFFLG